MSSGLDCGVNQVLKYVLSRTLRKVPSLMEGEVQEANAGVKNQVSHTKVSAVASTRIVCLGTDRELRG